MDERSPAAEGDAEERRHRRGLKFRKREDHAVELFQEAQANLADRPRVARILLELGRFYNPYIDAPIVDLATRRRIIEHLERAQTWASSPSSPVRSSWSWTSGCPRASSTCCSVSIPSHP